MGSKVLFYYDFDLVGDFFELFDQNFFLQVYQGFCICVDL